MIRQHFDQLLFFLDEIGALHPPDSAEGTPSELSGEGFEKPIHLLFLLSGWG
ncbi:MAG: hypothetical protein HY841_11580 [Bacteroidetes bacterium]|nr:hypothetical protein [Bacteroidota bacterium]